ncbi:MAG: tetratricopeptide repeat protein [Pyrinomonadaceae bacterium]|nr:tetratricopeptide repeat protein [Pyrinomonadaceae bacterium]
MKNSFRRSFATFLLTVSVSIFASSCNTPVPKRGSANYDEAVTRFFVGLAAVQVGNDPRAATELEAATKLASGEPAVWNNLGVLQLRQKDFEKAEVSLEKARELSPDNATVYFNLAILSDQTNESESLQRYLTKTTELSPNDLRSYYLLAEEFEKQKADKKALQAFEKILKRAPKNLAARLEAARLQAKLGEKENFNKTVGIIEEFSEAWPENAAEQFRKAKEAVPARAATEMSFLRNVLLKTPEYQRAQAKIKPSDTIIGDLIFRPVILESPDFRPAAPDKEISFEADAIESARSAKVIYLNSKDTPVVAVSGKEKTQIGDVELDFSAARPNQIAVFDFDYDFQNDIALAGESGFTLLKQNDGAFEDVTKDSGISLSGEMTGVWAFDFDNEGDLDLLVSSTDGNAVLRNNGNGTFETLKTFDALGEIVDFEYADLDEDGDGDALFLVESGSLVFFKNERGGLFEKQDGTGFSKLEASAMTVADTNGDGRLDLNIYESNGALSRFDFESGAKTGTKAIKKLGESVLRNCGNSCLLRSADFDNNGANDLVVSTGKESELFLGIQGGKFEKAANTIGAYVNDFADLNGDGKLDFLGIDKEGRATRLINRSTNTNGWQIVRPVAAKTEGDRRVNTFGIGGELETRSGLAVQKQLIRRPRVHFGLGNAKQSDVIRVIWQNGSVQAEFDIEANQVVAAEQRLKGSCPHLFTWNGEKFVHVKDSPPWSPALGLKISAQETFGIIQTEEWFRIPGEALRPKDGRYELRITGEYWETFYIDHYMLMAVDHPEGTEVFTNEKFSIPPPPLKVFTTTATKSFKSAKDHNDRDVLETISSLDEEYLDGIKRGKYQGVAEDHYVELELPDEAPRDKKLWVVADGWVHPTDASINVQRGQDVSGPPKSLSIEILDDNGNWITARENLGFPAGKMKTLLFDLDGLFGKNTEIRKLRIRTELEVFWDKLAWAVNEAGDENKTIEMELESASLRYRGFSVIEKADDSSPEVPDYSRILTTNQRWRDMVGYFTRYGDIKPLLLKTDDRYVISNAGDELVLSFKALPPPAEGFVRDFILVGDGWIKDGDLNSDFSKTVLPLPTQASNDYSRRPTTLEEDPVYQKNRKDWLKFHTRYVSPDGFRNALRVTDK